MNLITFQSKYINQTDGVIHRKKFNWAEERMKNDPNLKN